jgi:DNA helicase HerA-like ATPase
VANSGKIFFGERKVTVLTGLPGAPAAGTPPPPGLPIAPAPPRGGLALLDLVHLGSQHRQRVEERTAIGGRHERQELAVHFVGAGQRVCVIDPTDAWWGLRASADGGPSGLPVVILGGAKADLPLEEHHGAAVADLVVDGTASFILSIKHFESDASRVRFLLAFAQRVYHRNREPLHLVLDEADEYLPQVVTGDVAKLVNAWTRIVKLGRIQGLGITLITQRPATLNKSALSQIETLFALRTTASIDQDAIGGWMRQAGKAPAHVVDSLAALRKGEAWVWSPSFLEMPEPQRVQIRQRRTFINTAFGQSGRQRIRRRF